MRQQLTAVIIGVVVLASAGAMYLMTHNRQPSTTSSATVAVGQSAPDFSVQTTDGQPYSLAAHKGKPIIVFGLSGSCAHNNPAGNMLTRIKQDYAAKGVDVVGVDSLEGEPTNLLQLYREFAKVNFSLANYNKSVVDTY